MDKPTLATLVARARADMAARLGLQALQARSVERVLADVHAGGCHALWFYLAYQAKQMHPLTADELHLAQWARSYGIERLAAVAATGQVQFSGTAGAQILAGTKLRNADEGEYSVLAAVVIDADGSAIAEVAADASGVAGNRDGGEGLSLISEVAGVESGAVVISLSGGAAEESLEQWAARVDARMGENSRLGDSEDYQLWAVSGHPDVTDAWIYPHESMQGVITIRIVAGVLYDRVPDAATIALVQAYVDEQRPLGGIVQVIAPVARPVDFSISFLGGASDTSSNRFAISTALNDYINTRNERDARLTITQIRSVIDVITSDYSLLGPVSDVQAAYNELLTMGEVTWI